MNNFIEYRKQICGLARAFPAQASSRAEMNVLRFFKYVRKQAKDVLKDEWLAGGFLRRLNFASRQLKECVAESTNDALVQACKISLEFDISVLPVSYFFRELLVTHGEIMGVRSFCYIDSNGYRLELSTGPKTQTAQAQVDAFCEKVGIKNLEYTATVAIDRIEKLDQTLRAMKNKALAYSKAVHARINLYYEDLLARLTNIGVNNLDLVLIKHRNTNPIETTSIIY